MTRTIESGNLFVRVRSMLKLDFYRLFHTPALLYHAADRRYHPRLDYDIIRR